MNIVIQSNTSPCVFTHVSVEHIYIYKISNTLYRAIRMERVRDMTHSVASLKQTFSLLSSFNTLETQYFGDKFYTETFLSNSEADAS